jgi:hypothetical protein
VQWPEGFRLHPNAGWDDEIKRLSEAADVFERVANVVQSTLSELLSRLESLSRLPSPSLIRLLGQRAWPKFSLLSWSNRLEFHDVVLRTPHLGFAGSHRRPGRCNYRFRQHGMLDDLRGRQGGRAHDLVAIRWIRRWLRLMIISLWMLGKANPHRVDRGFRIMRSLR